MAGIKVGSQQYMKKTGKKLSKQRRVQIQHLRKRQAAFMRKLEKEALSDRPAKDTVDKQFRDRMERN